MIHESWPVCQPGHLALLIPHTWPFESWWTVNLHLILVGSILGTKEISFAENMAALEGLFLHLFYLFGTESKHNYPIHKDAAHESSCISRGVRE